MRERNLYAVWLGVFLALVAVGGGLYAFSGLAGRNVGSHYDADEYSSGQSVTIATADGRTVLQTAWPVEAGDLFFSSESCWYEVSQGEDGAKTAVPCAPPVFFRPERWASSPLPASRGVIESALTGPDGTSREAHVVIYHTHSDESYGYGTDIVSKPGSGDVYEVGEHLSAALRALGVSVTHSYAAHDPHDRAAYERSRETLLKLLPEQPDLVIDLHRDSAPVEAYVTTINGQLTARVMLVVGAANPNMETNLRYAYAFKEIADRIYPGLVRGIYIGRGNYNQDLYPSAMLMEFGTEGMSRDTAEKTAACVTDVLKDFLLTTLPALVQAGA